MKESLYKNPTRKQTPVTPAALQMTQGYTPTPFEVKIDKTPTPFEVKIAEKT